MSETVPDEKPVSQQVYTSTGEILDRLNQEFGIPRIQIMKRVMRFVDEQEKPVKQEFLRENGDPAGMLIKAKIAELAAVDPADAKRIAASLTHEQALAVARVMLDRAEKLHADYERELKARYEATKKKG